MRTRGIVFKIIVWNRRETVLLVKCVTFFVANFLAHISVVAAITEAFRCCSTHKKKL